MLVLDEAGRKGIVIPFSLQNRDLPPWARVVGWAAAPQNMRAAAEECHWLGAPREMTRHSPDGQTVRWEQASPDSLERCREAEEMFLPSLVDWKDAEKRRILKAGG